MDSQPKCKVMPEPKTKLHQLCYITTSEEDETSVMAVSTEDGRILFYSTSPDDLTKAAVTEGKDLLLPSGTLVAYTGGKEEGISGRIKDFTILRLDDEAQSLIIVGASSDGSIRLWKLSIAELKSTDRKKAGHVGSSIGIYETGNRITCLTAFVMLPQTEGAEEESEVEAGDGEEASSSDSE
jgi:protein MAK11